MSSAVSINKFIHNIIKEKGNKMSATDRNSIEEYMEVDNKRKTFFEIIVVIMIAVLITFTWYSSNHWSVLMGDDLCAVYWFDSLGLWGNLFNPGDISMGKIRPIQKIMLYLVYSFGGIDYKRYFLISRLFIVGASLVTYYVARKVSIDRLKSFIIMIFLVLCPFSAYGAWQYIGVSESFSLMCCMVYGCYSFKILYEENIKKLYKDIIISAVWFALLVFNAERFMYLVAVQALIIILKSKITWKNKVGCLVISISPILLRSFFLHIIGSDSLGTGRADIWTLLSTLIPYAIKGYINMLGFSIGDSWHGGFEITQLSPIVLVISVLRVFLCLGILYTSVRKVLIDKSKKYIEIVMWYLFSLTSLFSYALVASTHGEDRFLWISYMFYLIAVARYAEITDSCGDWKISNRKKKISVDCIIVLGCICVCVSHYYYRESKTHVHFRASQEMAQTAIESARELENFENAQNVACVKSSDFNWIFYGDSFFRYYLNENINVFYYNTPEELNNEREALGENTIVIYPDINHEIPYGTKALWINDFHEE